MPVSPKTLPILALAFAVLGPAAARAGGAAPSDDDKARMLEAAFGSTIVSTYPDGRQAELWLNRDGSYAAEGRRHDRSSGVWQVKGDKLCLRQRRPFPAPFSYCTGVPQDGLDKPWRGKAFTGEPITIKVVHGLQGRDAEPSQGAQASRPDGRS